MVLGRDGGPLVGMLPPERRSDSLRSKQVSPRSHHIKEISIEGSIVDRPFCLSVHSIHSVYSPLSLALEETLALEAGPANGSAEIAKAGCKPDSNL